MARWPRALGSAILLLAAVIVAAGKEGGASDTTPTASKREPGASTSWAIVPTFVSPANNNYEKSRSPLIFTSKRAASQIRQDATLVGAPYSIYFGAFVNPSPNPYPNTCSRYATAYECNTEALESAIGRTFATHLHYYQWNASFPGAQEAADAAVGRIPVDSWNCATGPGIGITNESIVDTSQDSQIETVAAAMAAYGGPIFLRFEWEMNLPLTDSNNNRAGCYDSSKDQTINGLNYFDATTYKNAYEHIRDIFAAYNATNVIFLWNPNADVLTTAQPMSTYYPGVDADTTLPEWFGIDFYAQNGVSQFWTDFGNQYVELEELNANWPIMLTETGLLAAGPGSQGTFFSEMPDELAFFPGVWGFNYFDAQNYTIKPSPMPSFAAMATNSYLDNGFNPQPIVPHAIGSPSGSINVNFAPLDYSQVTFYNTFAYSSITGFGGPFSSGNLLALVHYRFDKQTWGSGDNFEAAAVCDGYGCENTTDVQVEAMAGNPSSEVVYYCATNPSAPIETDMSVHSDGSPNVDINENDTLCATWNTGTDNQAAASEVALLSESTGTPSVPGPWPTFTNGLFMSDEQVYTGGSSWNYWPDPGGTPTATFPGPGSSGFNVTSEYTWGLGYPDVIWSHT